MHLYYFKETAPGDPSLKCYFNITSISKSSGDKTPFNKSAQEQKEYEEF